MLGSPGINPGGETRFTSGSICPLFHLHGLRPREQCPSSSSPPSRVASARQPGRGRAAQQAARRPQAGRPEGALLGSQPAAPLSGEPRTARWGHLGVRGRAQRYPPRPRETRPPPASPRTWQPRSSAACPELSRGRASFRPPVLSCSPLALPNRGDPAPRPQTAGPPAGATMKTQSPINYDDARWRQPLYFRPSSNSRRDPSVRGGKWRR